MSRFIYVCHILVVCFVARNYATVTEAQKAIIQSRLISSGIECMRDHPITLEDISVLRKRTVPDKDNVKCFIGCVYRKIGVIDGTGKISKKSAIKSAKQMFKDSEESVKKTEELIEKCLFVNDQETADEDKGCERAKLTFTCMVEHAPKFGLDVEF